MIKQKNIKNIRNPRVAARESENKILIVKTHHYYRSLYFFCGKIFYLSRVSRAMFYFAIRDEKKNRRSVLLWLALVRITAPRRHDKSNPMPGRGGRDPNNARCSDPSERVERCDAAMRIRGRRKIDIYPGWRPAASDACASFSADNAGARRDYIVSETADAELFPSRPHSRPRI